MLDTDQGNVELVPSPQVLQVPMADGFGLHYAFHYAIRYKIDGEDHYLAFRYLQSDNLVSINDCRNWLWGVKRLGYNVRVCLVTDKGYETEEDTDFSLPTDIWWIDLLIRADGTAQLRDVHDEVYLIDESTMHLTWEVQEDEQIYFYNELYEEPVVSGALEEDSLHLQYRGFELFLRQEEKPSEIGEQFIPAELAGTWIMVSGETEGWEWEAMPGHLETLVFSFMWDEYGPGLRADSQYCYYDKIEDSYWKNVVTVLDEPLYEGCENGTWSVRIGEESPKDENGYLTETEYYAIITHF